MTIQCLGACLYTWSVTLFTTAASTTTCRSTVVARISGSLCRSAYRHYNSYWQRFRMQPISWTITEGCPSIGRSRLGHQWRRFSCWCTDTQRRLLSRIGREWRPFALQRRSMHSAVRWWNFWSGLGSERSANVNRIDYNYLVQSNLIEWNGLWVVLMRTYNERKMCYKNTLLVILFLSSAKRYSHETINCFPSTLVVILFSYWTSA